MTFPVVLRRLANSVQALRPNLGRACHPESTAIVLLEASRLRSSSLKSSKINASMLYTLFYSLFCLLTL